ncbi:hypothetical protein KC678_00015 [Candidatus Dojkabacteria bacterium]|uniref:Uncharacterized protein n=1 Tax=Candidatus Dojkabacteria bacterium TaxID=2099670 RepID=A0A955IA25_9BACT|nr:hypothetical protein [Candidatus Dojkabacteria bacterium]
MIESLFWVILRSIAIPLVAYMSLRTTFLGEQGALLAVGIALAIVTVTSLAWNILKIIGNTLLLRGEAIVFLLLQIAIQIISLLLIWGYYFKEYTDLLN